jgi:hypothetical protein
MKAMKSPKFQWPDGSCTIGRIELTDAVIGLATGEIEGPVRVLTGNGNVLNDEPTSELAELKRLLAIAEADTEEEDNNEVVAEIEGAEYQVARQGGARGALLQLWAARGNQGQDAERALMAAADETFPATDEDVTGDHLEQAIAKFHEWHQAVESA